MDAIDVQELVDYTKALIAKGLKTFIMGVIVKEFPPAATGVLQQMLSSFLDYVVKLVLNYFDKMAFNLNIDLLTSDQAADYRDAVAKLIKAPDDISDQEWERLENEASSKFDNLVRLTK